jgi:O-antigen/teichoic acid export membrane protein
MAFVPRKTYLGPIAEGVPGEVMHFAKWVIVACMCTALSQGIDVFMLSAYDVPRESIGHYRAAISLALVGELAVMTLFQVLLPKASQLTTAEELIQFLRRYQSRTLLAGVAMLPALFIAEPICTLVFGQDFAGTGQLFAILLVGTACVLTSAPAGAVVYAGGRSPVIAALEALKIVFIFAIGLWAAPRYGALGMAYTMAVVRGVIAAATYGAARWTIKRLPAQS